MDDFHSLDPEDLPEELLQLLQGIARKAMDTGLAHDPAEDEMMPSSLQLLIKPGDFVAVTHSTADGEFTVAEVVNPEEHVDEFPDWEDRLLRSYLLTRWSSPTNLLGSLGWVPRACMVQVSEDQYLEMCRWMREVPEDIKNGPPDWLILVYGEAMVEIAKANPERMAMPIQCSNCRSYGVVVELVMTKRLLLGLGLTSEDRGKEARDADDLYETTKYLDDSSSVTTMLCKSCGYTEVLPEAQHLYGTLAQG